MPRCDIIIPVWNQLELTRRCLNSIVGKTGKDIYRIFLINNASDYETSGYLKDFKENNDDVYLIENNRNLGFVKAVNIGIHASIKEGVSDYICLLNNDTVVREKWLSELIKTIERDMNIAIVNPSSNTLGISPDTELKGDDGDYMEMPRCTGFCMLFRKRLIEEIGYFDEIFGMGNFEDSDFSERAKQKGYKCVRSLKSYVYHEEGGSFSFFKGKNEEFEKNKKIFESRYGMVDRFLYVFTNFPEDVSKFEEKIKQDSIKGNWIWIICPSGKTKILSKKYPQVKVTYTARWMIPLIGLMRTLVKKKRFTNIYINGSLITLGWFRILNFRKANIALIG